jgi:dTDP-L-rhamnose 4-epimerase
MVLMLASSLGLDAIALRYQNVYGPGQSLHNPYTGILATFSNLVRQGRGIDVFEDGRESRDFVFIDDVVAANVRSLHAGPETVGAFNVGSGVGTSVLAVAEAIAAYFNAAVDIGVSGQFRVGDIRHALADTRKLRGAMGFAAETAFEDGLHRFLDWATGQSSGEGHDRSIQELRERGLLRGPN